MTKKHRILNQWARHNISILTPMTIDSIKRGDWLRGDTGILKCVSCGRYQITGPIVRYFDFSGSKLVCYDCQSRHSVGQSGPVAVKDILAHTHS